MKKLSYEKVYKIFLLFLATWIGLGLLMPVMVPDLVVFKVLFASSIVLLIFLSIYLLTGKQKMIPIIITSVVLLGGFFSDQNASIGHIENYFKWVSGQQIAEFNILYQYLNIVFATMVFIPFALLLGRLSKLRLLIALLLFGGLLYGVYSKTSLDKTIICFCILYISFVITELLQDESLRQKIVIGLLPFLGIYMVLILLLPTKDEPYDWKTVRMIYRQVYDVVENIANRFSSSSGEGFGLEVVGFSGEGRVGGDRANRIRNEMLVNQTSGRRMTIYLRGNAFEKFDGKTWKSNDDITEGEYSLDLLETLYAIERFDPGSRADYITRSNLKITYTDLNTSFLFAPLKIVNISQALALGAAQYGSEFRFDSLRGKGTEYDLVYYQMNLGQRLFQEMIIAQHQYQYNDSPPDDKPSHWDVTALDYLWLLGEDSASLEQMLEERRDNIYLKYTEKYPLSDEVRDFLAEIIKDAENDFEKVKALERTLSGLENIDFIYTKTPGELPRGKNFLDYFLLESQSGYCTYYATAFTLLVRELGLPARYVQGFMVYDDGLGRKPVTIKNTMAHAWPEVYFDGVGWISFEPTPGFRAFRYQFWTPLAEIVATSGAFRPQITDEDPEEDFAGHFESERRNIISLIPYALIIIASIILAFAIFIIIDYLIKKYRLSRYDLNGQFTEHIRMNLQILGCLGFHFLHGETIHEFKERIKCLDNSIPHSFLEQYEFFLYRKTIADTEMITITQNDRQTLYKAIKESDIWKYYLIRLKMLLR